MILSLIGLDIARESCAMLSRTFLEGNDHGVRIEVVRRKGTSQIVHGVEARRITRYEEREERIEGCVEERIEAGRQAEERGEEVDEADEEVGSEDEVARVSQAIAGHAHQARGVDRDSTRNDCGEAGRPGGRTSGRRSEGSRHLTRPRLPWRGAAMLSPPRAALSHGVGRGSSEMGRAAGSAGSSRAACVANHSPTAAKIACLP